MSKQTIIIFVIAAIALVATLTFLNKDDEKVDEPKKQKETTQITGIAAADKFIETWSKEKGGIDKSQANWKLRLPEPDLIAFDPEVDYIWHLETSKGDIKIKLMPDVAPVHVTNTIYLTRVGFYDDLSFHRVIPKFMMQGGCPNGNGSGGPGYKFAGEFDPEVSHDRRGLLSAANSGPKTDGSQFFITFQPYLSGDGKHTIYGEVIDGDSTMIKIENQGTGSGTPKRPLLLKSAKIHEVPKSAK